MFSSDLRQLLILWVSSNFIIYSSASNFPNEGVHYDENEAVKYEGINYASFTADLKAYFNSEEQTNETTLFADCNCRENGECVVENGKNVCKCKPEYGYYEYGKDIQCKACNCGKGHNCTISVNYWTGVRITCVCKANYKATNGKCVGPCEPDPCKNGGTCMDDGTNFNCICTPDFSGNTCTTEGADPCTNNPCQNGGTCSVVGESFSCKCKSPYTGITCETSPCSKNPCQNGGNCNVGGESFSCKCKSPYTGITCETSPCTKNTCQNGGTCSVVGESFSCKCNSPYTGITCETNLCTANPCLNNGICKLEGSSFKCECKSPYFGQICEKDPCTKNPCNNGGTCNLKDNTFRCQCKTPYFGNTCDNDPCTVNPCKHGGMCEMQGSSYKCSCQTPYFGVNCTSDPCTMNPCNNEGTCSLTDNAFKCQCKTPYSGNTCDIDPCTLNPCQNGGTCALEGTSFKCSCKNPFFGSMCESDPCTVNPCQNGGTCTLEGNSYECSCQTPFFGTMCENGCDCGQNSLECRFDKFGNKICFCNQGHSQIDGLCSDCYCGDNAVGCDFDGKGKKICSCSPGYSQKNRTCTATCRKDSDCSNGGICRLDKIHEQFCVCSANFRGDLCEKSLMCEKLDPSCRAMGAVCRPSETAAVCECPAEKAYQWKSGMCEDICDDRKCVHGKCETFGITYRCRCYNGYGGLNCDTIFVKEPESDSLWKYFVFATNFTVVILVIGIIFFLCRSTRCKNKTCHDVQ